jgi:tRNA pseudouridine55 synthase
VVAVRRTLQTRRVGHAGTLDPFATGLLVVLVGRATRLARFVLALRKSYSGTIRLGISTSTDDPTGEVIDRSDTWTTIGDGDIRAALVALSGRKEQRPPRYSAKSVAGRRAYRRARRGETFELEPTAVEVHRLELLTRRGPDLEIEAEVGSGVYLRALARDVGQQLRCGGHLHRLRRTAIGDFVVDQAVSLEAFDRSSLRPASDAVAHLPAVQLDDESHVAVRHGRPITGRTTATGPVALYAGGDLVAVADPDGDLLRPSVVLEGA